MASSVLTWLGHAFFSINSGKGLTILIDPWIKGNPSCHITLDDIKRADLILVTHDHFDHSGDVVAIATKTGAKVVATPETTAKFISQGVPKEQTVYETGMNIGGKVILDDITIVMTQAFHTSETGAATGYIVKFPDGGTIYHAGDTGIFFSMEVLGELYPLDMALIPIGGVYTMDPYQAARALKLLKPKKVIPMHFATFPILEPNAKEFQRLAKEVAPEVEIVVLEPGQSYTLR